jgi:macrodomain Ter protein organizer (MatP/YcbG family)
MRIKVESGGKIFRNKRNNIEKVHIVVKKLNNTTYEIEIKKVRVVTVKVDYKLYEKMTDYAKKNKITISDVIRKALSQFLNG